MKTICFFVPVFACVFILSINNSAYATTDEIEAFSKSESLIKVSLDYIKVKDYDRAQTALEECLRAAQNIKEPFSKALILSEILDKHLLLNKTEEALSIVRDIGLSDAKDDGLSKIAYKYAELKNYGRAIDTVRQIKSDSIKALACYKIAGNLTEARLYDKVQELIKKFNDSRLFVHKLVLMQIFSRSLKPGFTQKDRPDILQTLPEHLNEPFYTCYKMVEAANGYFSLMLYEPAKKILSEAQNLAGHIDRPSLKIYILRQIENTYKKIGRWEKNMVGDKNNRSG